MPQLTKSVIFEKGKATKPTENLEIMKTITMRRTIQISITLAMITWTTINYILTF